MAETTEALARTRAIEAIQAGLLASRWPPGTVLQEQEIARELRLSKTPVREALLTLAAKGRLVSVPRVGYAVPGLSLADLAELFTFRALIEGEVVTALASRGHAVACAGQTDSSAVEAEHAFHRAMAASAGGGPRLRGALEELVDATTSAMAHLDMPQDIARALADEHAALSAAIAARDLRLARALSTVHLTRMRETLMATLRQRFRDENLLA